MLLEVSGFSQLSDGAFLLNHTGVSQKDDEKVLSAGKK